MSSDPTTWIVVDDTSPDITYVGGTWFASVGAQDKLGTFGPPYLSTVHGTSSSASLSFSFSGTAVMVAGTMLLREDGGVLDPKWECFVDGKSIGANSALGTVPETNKNICGPITNLPDGQHTITVNATIARNQTFWFDNIQYAPSANANLENKAIMLQPSTEGFRYGPSWSVLKSVGVPVRVASEKGSRFTYDFYGSSLSWYSVIPHEFPGGDATASFAVDGQAPQSFLVKGHAPGEQTTYYHQKLFDTPSYPSGNHQLSVEFNGDSTTTPLTLYYLVVQNGTFSSAPLASPGGISGSGSNPSSTSTSQPSITAGSTTNASVSHSVSIGAIIGIVIGGICVVGLLILLIYLIRRDKRKNQHTFDSSRLTSNPPVDPFYGEPPMESIRVDGSRATLAPPTISSPTSSFAPAPRSPASLVTPANQGNRYHRSRASDLSSLHLPYDVRSSVGEVSLWASGRATEGGPGSVRASYSDLQETRLLDDIQTVPR